MKVCLVALVILVSNQATAENERTSGGRQAKQLSLSEPEQKYDLELSFPVDSDEATNVDDGRRERIDQLIQEILSNEALFYDRVGKHTYQPRPEEKSGADTSSESDDDRSRRQ